MDIRFTLNKEQANFIKTLRMADYPWVSIAREVVHRYPDLKIRIVSTEVGINLCSAAMRTLNERIDQGWN